MGPDPAMGRGKFLDENGRPIELPFGLRTWVGPGNHVLDGGPDPPMGRGKFWGENGRPIVKFRDTLGRLCKDG